MLRISRPDLRCGATPEATTREPRPLDGVLVVRAGFDPATGESSQLLQENSDVWINLHKMFRPLKKQEEHGAAFIWASERSGFMHLYLLDEKGEVIRPLTSGEWQIDEIAGVDEKEQLVYFLATKATPLEKHLYVKGNPSLLSQVFMNLLVNAAQAMQTEGQLTIEAFVEEEGKDPLYRFSPERRNGSVIVSFHDTGPGIPEELVKNIFNPFFTTKDKGTGLGLATSQRIIDQHRGELSFRSRVGVGTTFAVTLPLAVVVPDVVHHLDALQILL